MKKLLVLLLTVFALNSCEKDPEIIGIDAEKKMPKVDVCHYDADTDTWKTISINENALKAHLAHGDTQGDRCGYTYIPDDSFEAKIKCMGYDDVLDNYVLTSNLHMIERLDLNDWGDHNNEGWGCEGYYSPIYDLTGIEDFINLKSFYSFEPYGLSNIDLSENKNLESFGIETDNPGTIETITLDDNPKLISVSINNVRNLSNLLLTNSIKLRSITLYGTKLVELDLSSNPNITDLHILHTQIEKLNLKNGNNEILTNVNFSSSNLKCIQVDNADDANNGLFPYSSWDFEPDVTYSEDCY